MTIRHIDKFAQMIILMCGGFFCVPQNTVRKQRKEGNTMKNMKFWRTALVATLVLTVMLSVTGGTIAWFTDSVASGRNVIQAGNLDVELYNADGKVGETTSLFDLPTLWEPGAVAWENLTVKNVGTLALKYQMGMNYINENTVDGYGLSQVLKVGVVDGGFEANATREDVVGKVASWGTFASFGAADALAAGAEKTYGVVVYWQPTAEDNNWNVNNGKQTSNGMDYLHIDLGLKLEATQQTAEFDSFDDQYDKDAPVILPAGVTAETFATNNAVAYANGTYYATLKAALEGLHANAEAGIATAADSSATNVLYLKPDADLGTVTHAHVCESLTVYGNGAYISSGEADFEVDTYKFCHNGAKACAGVTGELTLNIYNLTGVAVWGQRTTENTINVNLYDCQDMNRVYISGESGVTNVNIENCTYDGTTGQNNTAVYTNNPGTINVKDTVIKAYAIGINQNNKSAGTQTINLTNVKFVDCATAEIASAVNATSYAAPVRVIASAEGAVSNLNIVNCEYEYYTTEGPVDVNVLTMDKREGKPNNGTVNVKVDAEVVITDNLQLGKALKAAESGYTVKVYEGTYTFPASDMKAGVTLECAEGTVFEGTSKLNIKGATVVGATFSNPSGTAADQTINGTFKDCTFTGSNGLRWCYAGETVVFENCVFSGDVYGVHFDGGANEVVFKNCTFSGFNAMGSAITQLTMEGCTFKANGKSSYNGINLWGNTKMKDCTFIFDGSASYEWVDACTAETTVEYENCFVIDENGTKSAVEMNDVFTRRNDSTVIIINGVTQ